MSEEDDVFESWPHAGELAMALVGARMEEPGENGPLTRRITGEICRPIEGPDRAITSLLTMVCFLAEMVAQAERAEPGTFMREEIRRALFAVDIVATLHQANAA